MKRRFSLVLIMFAPLVLAPTAGDRGDDFAIDWWTVDAGGEMFTTGGEPDRWTRGQSRTDD